MNMDIVYLVKRISPAGVAHNYQVCKSESVALALIIELNNDELSRPASQRWNWIYTLISMDFS